MGVRSLCIFHWLTMDLLIGVQLRPITWPAVSSIGNWHKRLLNGGTYLHLTPLMLERLRLRRNIDACFVELHPYQQLLEENITNYFWGHWYNSPSSPALVMLNLGMENFPIQFCTVVTNILFKGHWKLNLAPNAWDTFELVKTHFVYEKLLALRREKYSVFENSWKPWAHWAKQESLNLCHSCHVMVLTSYKTLYSSFMFLFSTPYLASEWCLYVFFFFFSWTNKIVKKNTTIKK